MVFLDESAQLIRRDIRQFARCRIEYWLVGMLCGKFACDGGDIRRVETRLKAFQQVKNGRLAQGGNDGGFDRRRKFRAGLS